MRLTKTKAKGGKKPRREPERAMQVNLFTWAKMASGADPRLKLLFAVPNGGKRDYVTAARMQAEGVKPGVPDIFLPVAAHGHHGVFIELKAGKNKPSDHQTEWLLALEKGGYVSAVVYDDWQIAKQILEAYLLPDRRMTDGAELLPSGWRRVGDRLLIENELRAKP
jgi:hypothetical protein